MLIGHERIWNFLIQSAGKHCLAHAYLFVGPPEIGKSTLAEQWARWLFCQTAAKNKTLWACGVCQSCESWEKNLPPDVFLLAPIQREKDGEVKTLEIKIEQVRDLQHQLNLSPYQASYKIAIIEEADWLTLEAGNAFLKTLEEPSSRSLLILTASTAESLLPTIVSRCQLIKFLPVPTVKIEAGLAELFPQKSVAERKMAARLAGGRPGQALKLLRESGGLVEQKKNIEFFQQLLKRDLVWRFAAVEQLARQTGQANEILEQLIFWLRDRLLEEGGRSGLPMSNQPKEVAASYSIEKLRLMIREIQKTQAIISNPSFNARLALEALMLKL